MTQFEPLFYDIYLFQTLKFGFCSRLTKPAYIPPPTCSRSECCLRSRPRSSRCRGGQAAPPASSRTKPDGRHGRIAPRTSPRRRRRSSARTPPPETLPGRRETHTGSGQRSGVRSKVRDQTKCQGSGQRSRIRSKIRGQVKGQRSGQKLEGRSQTSGNGGQRKEVMSYVRCQAACHLVGR